MLLTLKRKYRKANYTIGELYIDNKYFCDTLEDTDRELSQNMSLYELEHQKIKGKTCIPYGIYDLTLNIKSPKYSNFIKYPWAKETSGYLPRLSNVPAFDGVLIHVGNTPQDTEGCILVGQNKIKGQVINSRITFSSLYKKLKEANNKKEPIKIFITK